jgi:tetratricopeptide (TPR) repeat protein
MIVGAIVLAPSLAAWAAIPFTRFIDGIYLPGGPTGDDPEPNYRLADHYYEISQNRLAIEEYEKIIRYHPDETRAYIALIDLWVRCGDAHRAAKLYRRGLRKSRSREARHQLRDAYRTCRDQQGHSETEEGTLC